MWRIAPPFGELLAGCQRSALHLETRDHYDDPDEAPRVRAWKSGYRPDPADRATWWRPWLDLVAETVGRGVEIRRARIVSEPVSEYIRYEHALTPLNLEAGEGVRWLPRRQALGIALPANDFWLIDGALIRFNHFTGDGEAADPEMCEEAAVAQLCATAFEEVGKRGLTHDEFAI